MPISRPNPLMTTSPIIPFDSLSEIEKRKAIAADAIAQLGEGRLIPKTGHFLEYRISSAQAIALIPESLKANLIGVPQCEACALGGLMLGQLRVNGDCALNEVTTYGGYSGSDRVGFMPYIAKAQFARRDQSTYSPFLTRYFAADQITLIEVAFEEASGAFGCSQTLDNEDESDFEEKAEKQGTTITFKQAKAAVAFGRRFEKDADRFRAIMGSIIGHPEGLFVP